MKKALLIVTFFLSNFIWSQVGADESIIFGITVPNVALSGNDLVNWVPSDALRTFYVAADGNSTNDGLTPQNPISFDHAVDIMQDGDLFWCKSGDYGFRQYDFSNKFRDRNNPVAFIGYKNTIGDIVSLPYSGFNSINQGDVVLRPVKPPKIAALPTNSVGHHLWNSTEMPTFRGDQSNAPNYIVDDPVFLHSDGGEEGLIFRNFQFQFYQEAIELTDADYTLFDNIRFSYNGRFENIAGQGGSNQELRGGAIHYRQNGSNVSSYNVVKNCYAYNMAHSSFTFSQGTYNQYVDIEAFSDINEGNPQDYYTHTTGKYNFFLRTRSVRNVESRHSGHGICYNYGAEYNMNQDCYIYGTSHHFDASHGNYSLNLTLVGEPDFGYFLNGQDDGNNVLPYTGGSFTFMDDANNNLVVGASFNVRGVSNFQDSGAHATPDHASQDSAGHNNTVRNSTVNGGSEYTRFVSFANWSGTTEARNNLILNNTISDIDYLIFTSRNNSGNVFQGNTFNNIRNGLIDFDDEDTLNPNTVFSNNIWNNSDLAKQQAQASYIFSDDDLPPTNDPDFDVYFNENNVFVSQGNFRDLGLTFLPLDTSDKTGTLTVNNDNVIIYYRNDTVIIEASKVGTSLVTFTSNNGEVMATSYITVLPSNDNFNDGERKINLKTIQRKLWN